MSQNLKYYVVHLGILVISVVRFFYTPDLKYLKYNFDPNSPFYTMLFLFLFLFLFLVLFLFNIHKFRLVIIIFTVANYIIFQLPNSHWSENKIFLALAIQSTIFIILYYFKYGRKALV